MLMGTVVRLICTVANQSQGADEGLKPWVELRTPGTDPIQSLSPRSGRPAGFRYPLFWSNRRNDGTWRARLFRSRINQSAIAKVSPVGRSRVPGFVFGCLPGVSRQLRSPQRLCLRALRAL